MEGRDFETVEKRSWQVVAKNETTGEPEVFDLHYKKEKVAVDIGKLLIRQALPTRITPSRRVKPRRADTIDISLPDAQIPFHDPIALKAAHLAVREIVPDNQVFMGDWLDFPTLSRFEHRPEWTGQVQSSLDILHTELAQFRADAPDSKMYYLWGNHEERLQKHMVKHNAELLGIKRANAAKDLGVMTLEFLLRLGELEVEVVGGYPNGELWLEDHLVYKHGNKVKQNQSTSIEYLKENPHVNTVHGHSHRAEVQWRTTPTKSGHIDRFAASAGTLADRTGSVPSYNSSINERGQIVRRAENWQQAVLIVEHNKERANPHLATIQDGQIMLPGKTYVV